MFLHRRLVSAGQGVCHAGGIDQDGNGLIDSTEGVNAAPPYDVIGSRDGLRQTVVDLMQLEGPMTEEAWLSPREQGHVLP